MTVIAQTDRSSRMAQRLGHANRRLTLEQGRRLPGRLRNTFERMFDADHGATIGVLRGSLLDVTAPERA